MQKKRSSFNGAATDRVDRYMKMKNEPISEAGKQDISLLTKPYLALVKMVKVCDGLKRCGRENETV
jgi:hypothetical protein